MKKENFKGLVNGIKKTMIRKSPEILIGIGIAGMVTTAVLAVKATPKALDLIHEKEEELGVEKLTAGETVKTTTKKETAKEETGIPIVTELMSTDYIDEFVENVDVIQIGARNMQNYDLLKQVGRTRKPILLKRGLSATIEEWLMSAEYIMAGGNENVILCERGIRTFETITRNTLDLQAVPVVKRLSHLPIIVDPSHAGGYSYLVEPMAKAAVIAGADGLMIEVHNNPEKALSDGQQSLTPDQFDSLMEKVKKLAEIEDKHI